MRVARVYTNRTCNQNCAFCDVRQPTDERELVRTSAVLRRIHDSTESASTLVLTGGEPTMRRDLDMLVGAARGRGVEVELETNGALLDHSRIEELVQAGVGLLRFHLPAWEGACDDITRDPGGFQRTVRAIRAALTTGVAVEIAVPIVEANEAVAASLPRRLSDAGLVPRSLVVSVPTAAPSSETILPLPRAAAVVEALEAAARRHDIAIRLEPHSHVPPCLFESPARVAHMFALTPGGARRHGYRQVDSCRGCQVRDRCPGVPESLATSLAPLRPIVVDRTRRRLSIIESVEKQIERELYQEDIHRRPGEASIPGRTVRINFRCNQSCRFCFVSTHLPAAEGSAVRSAIVESARSGGYVVISGGEPTLNPDLLEYVDLAKREGAHEVELQTNATRLAGNDLARDLREAGLDTAFVSLHGSHAELSDTVTGAPGTFDKTVGGIDALIEAGIDTRLNFVFCQANAADFPSYVSLVANRWPEARVTVSFVAASTDVVPKTPDLIPRYSEVLPHLVEGLRVAERCGVEVSGFESMCGIPLCLVPADVSESFLLPEVPDGYDRGEFIKADACRQCDLDGKCFGVRRGYAELHGTDEFRPVTGSTGDRLSR